MSRIGKLPIELPSGVELSVSDDNIVTAKGSLGVLEQKITPEIAIEIKDNQVTLTRPAETKRLKALHGLSRSLLNNLVIGVSKGFEVKLELVGVGYKAAMQGTKLVLNVGFSHPVEFEPGENVEIEVPAPTKIVVKGIDKQAVGNLAAVIRRTYPPEPYKGKGIRYENEVVRQKVGKAGK